MNALQKRLSHIKKSHLTRRERIVTITVLCVVVISTLILYFVGTGSNLSNLLLPPGTPRLVWDDEFDGPQGAAPDSTKWTADVGPSGNHELEYYTNNKNAALDGKGDLVLEAKKQVTPGSNCPKDPITGSTDCQYTSASINTYGHFSFTYGRVEARIKVSGTQGLWPAFWMLGNTCFSAHDNSVWPVCGEIDIMEHLGKAPSTIYSTLHGPTYKSNAGGYSLSYTLENNVDFSSGFHIFSLDWGKTYMTFSVDGVGFFTIVKKNVVKNYGAWNYDHPFFLLLDNAVGGDWPGSPDASTVFPQRMIIDYVRVYQ